MYEKKDTIMNQAVRNAATIAFIAAILLHAGDDARAIMKQSYDAMKLQGSESITTLSIADNKGNKRVRKFSSATKSDPGSGVVKSVMRFLEPADVAGTSVLIHDHDDRDADMWIYMPALRKTRRLVTSEKSKSFMGSEFSNADITTPAIDDYRYTLAGAETVGDVDCWKIDITPVDGKVAAQDGYAKKTCLVGKADFVARRTAFYDAGGVLLKTLNVASVKVLDGKGKKYQATDIGIVNARNGRSSRFVVDTIAPNPAIKDDFFTPAYLEKR